MINIQEFIRRSQFVTNLAELEHLFQQAAHGQGYDYSAFARIKYQAIHSYFWHDFPSDYIKGYFENNWDRVDPIPPFACQTRNFFFWSDVFRQPLLTTRQKRFQDHCKVMGIRSGLTIPLHGPGSQIDIANFVKCYKNPENKESAAFLFSIAHQTRVRFTELTEGPPKIDVRPVTLTGREFECLKWIRDGKTNSEIAEILGISNKTVEFHLSNAMVKLGANNRIMALIHAIQLGILDI